MPPAALKKPDLVLRAGIVGALEVEADKAAPLANTAREVCRTLAGALAEEGGREGIGGLFSEQRPLVRVLSSLAAGVDQIVAGEALGITDAGSDFDLQCILPFDGETFRDSSIGGSPTSDPAAAMSRFDELYAKAGQVVELDGRFEKGEGGAAARHRAYRACAWFLLQQCDVLVAAFDPRVPGGAGGTLETVKHALHASVPVLWIDLGAAANAAGQLPVRVLSRRRDLDVPPAPDGWQSRVAEVVHGLVHLPEGDGSARRTMAEFYAADPPRGSHRNTVWKWFMRLVAGGSSTAAPAIDVQPFETYRRRAAGLSRYYTGRYRGAFLLNFFLLTVVVVVAAGFESVFGGDSTPVWLAVLKLGIIIWIYWNAHVANSQRWHRRGIDYRILAELLRSSSYLAPLGVATPRSRLPVQYSLNDLRHSWSIWLFRSIVRAEPIVATSDGCPPVANLDSEAQRAARDGIVNYWIKGQVEHHGSTATTMGRVFSRLESTGRWLVRLMLLTVVAQAGLEIYNVATGGEGGGSLWAWLVLVGAVAPAVVASCAGIVYQSEARRLAERSAAMAAQLDEWKVDLEEAPPHPDGSDAWTLARDALAIAQVIADEVADWHMLNQPHEVGVG